MKVKMILPALKEAGSPDFRPIKYSLFPPLGLATLAGYLDPTDDVEICDEHVEKIDLDDYPDLVVIQCYITSANRSFAIADHYRARGVKVAMGGLYPTARPELTATHADYVFVGPVEESWPRFMKDFKAGKAFWLNVSQTRCLSGQVKPRRDLIKKDKYLVPNTLVVSRGCPHHCDFCYKDGFYAGGKSYYQAPVDHALEEAASLPGQHLFFLDDNLFADRNYAIRLFDGLAGMNRLWQGAGTIKGVMDDELLRSAAKSGLRSLFIGFETLSTEGLSGHNKQHNKASEYSEAIKRLQDYGIMINASFVFGMDGDDLTVFDRTVDWAVEQGLETATFHILTPYPGTALHKRMVDENRIISHDTELYDTRHAVFQPARMTPEQLEAGYHRAYTNFYRWESILKSAAVKSTPTGVLRHLAYSGGWKKLEFLWAPLIRMGLLNRALPLLEKVLRTGQYKRSEEKLIVIGGSHVSSL